MPSHIQFPAEGNALYDTKIGFHAIAGIPHILGTIDGMLIQILAPNL